MKNYYAVLTLIVFTGIFHWYLFGTNQVYQIKGDHAIGMALEEWSAKYKRAGEEQPRWAEEVCGGMPSVGSLISVRQYNPILRVYDWITGYSAHKSIYGWLWIFFAIAALGVYHILKDLKVNQWIAAVCGFLYAYTPIMVVYADVGHGSKLMTIAFLPWVLFYLRRTFEITPWYCVQLFIAIAFMMLSLHVQIAYYGFMMIGLYCVMNYKKVAPIIATVMASIFGVCCAAPLYAKIHHYSQFSTRGTAGVGWDYATQWSFHPFESLTYLFPNWFGFGGITYTGYMPHTDAPLYWGLAILTGFIIYLFTRKKDRFGWFLITLAIMAWVVSFGKHFPILYRPFYEFLPMFDKFRAPMMIQCLTMLAAVLLAGRGMQWLLKKFSAGTVAVMVLAVIGIAEFTHYGKSLVHPVSAQTVQEYLAPDSVVKFLQEQEKPFRVFDLTGYHDKNWYASHHIESIGGFSGAKLQLYQDALDSLFNNWNFLRYANVKYIITSVMQDMDHPELRLVFGSEDQLVYEFLGTYPRVFFADEVLSGGIGLFKLPVTPDRVVFMEELPVLPLHKGDVENVFWLSKTNDSMELVAEVDTHRLLFFSEIYYPEWSATIDGKSTPVLRCNHLFRGIIIPPGLHRVKMWFNK